MVDKLSEEHIKQLHTTFMLLDGDGDGRIDAVDLQKFLSTFNSNFSLQELEAFINEESCQPNGVLDFPEFLNVLSRLVCDALDVAPDIDDAEIQRVFNDWDKDGDGVISANDLREVVLSLGEEWSDENVNDMIYYKKKDGVFTFQDLKDVLLGGRARAPKDAGAGAASGAR